MGCRLAVDVGGTFTDLLLFDEQAGELRLLKTPSTPRDQTDGIRAGVEKLIAEAGTPAGEIEAVLHGTTVPGDIVRDGTGARIGLLTTQGFEQVLHLARGRVPEAPGAGDGGAAMALADLALTRGVPERVNAQGDVITPLDEGAARRAIRALIDARVEAITVSLLHACANPAHEQRLRSMIAEQDPELPVWLSSEAAAEPREYERTLLAVLNAYASPGLQRYVARLEDRLRELQLSSALSIARADGGRMSTRQAVETPAEALFSGAAGGATAAAMVAGEAGCPEALGFDMGGSGTTVSVIRNGRPPLTGATRLGDLPVSVPSVDVLRAGAGAGAIAHVTAGGALRVGPQGAGTEPGPACYGRGGSEPTLTDANVVLGRLPPALLGGEMRLDVKAAEEAVGRVARVLGTDLQQTAEDILALAEEDLAGTLRQAAAQRGRATEDCALVAFGGAGPLHANAAAMRTGSYPVIVPPTPGVLAAYGFLCADVRRVFSRSWPAPLDSLEAAGIAAALGALQAEARAWLQAEGVDAAAQRLSCAADLRYAGLDRTRALEVDPEAFDEAGLRALGQQLDTLYQRRVGFAPDRPVELVGLRVTASGATTAPAATPAGSAGADAQAAVQDELRVWFDGAPDTCKVYDRARLKAGNRIAGPAIVSQLDATTVIHPGHLGVVDGRSNILIQPDDGTGE